MPEPNAIEDEIHFLFECPIYHDESLKLYQKLPEILNIVDKVERYKYPNSHANIFGKYIIEIW